MDEILKLKPQKLTERACGRCLDHRRRLEVAAGSFAHLMLRVAEKLKVKPQKLTERACCLEVAVGSFARLFLPKIGLFWKQDWYQDYRNLW